MGVPGVVPLDWLAWKCLLSDGRDHRFESRRVRHSQFILLCCAGLGHELVIRLEGAHALNGAMARIHFIR